MCVRASRRMRFERHVRDDLEHQTRMLGKLLSGVVENLLDEAEPAFFAHGALRLPGDLDRPNLDQVMEQIALFWEVVEKGGLGDLDLVAKLLDWNFIQLF